MGASTVGTGKTYTLLSTWESAKQADLTGLGPEIANCFGVIDEGSTPVSISGWTTTSADYVLIQGDASEPQPDGRSREVAGAAQCPQLTSTSPSTNGVLNIPTLHVRVADMEVYNSHLDPNFPAVCINLGAPLGSDIRLNNMVVWNYHTHTDSHALRLNSWQTNATIENCVVYTYSGIPYFGWNPIAGSISFCTFRTVNSSITVWAEHVTITNCVSVGGSKPFVLDGTTSGSNNASTNGSAPFLFSDSIQVVAADEFYNVASDNTADFRLKAGADLEGAGVPIGGITTDIAGNLRHATTPDIGMSEDGVLITSVSTDDIILTTEDPWIITGARFGVR